MKRPQAKNQNVDMSKVVIKEMMNSRDEELLYKELKPFFLKFFNKNEELFNDFFMKILDKRMSIDREKNLFNWLYTIAKNIRYDFSCPKKPEEISLEFLNKAQGFSDKTPGLSIGNESYESIMKSVNKVSIEEFESQNFDDDEGIDEKVERVLRVLLPAEAEFVTYYINKKETKTGTEKVRFYRLKKKIIIKNN